MRKHISAHIPLAKYTFDTCTQQSEIQWCGFILRLDGSLYLTGYESGETERRERGERESKT